MGLPQNPSPAHLYSQELQLKLYQAFIFSIPVLFSIILFLLFYLFYLKRRAYSLSSPSPILPTTLHQPTSSAPSLASEGLKGEVKGKLPVILVDEDLRAKDVQCSVCLGEFEMKEELHQVPSCQHVFHVDCLAHWIHSNATCPLCRCSIHTLAPPTSTTHLALASRPQPPPPQEDSFVDSNFTNHSRDPPLYVTVDIVN
ncbi:E3 ubiquitin-protein ligase RHA4A [Actinidia chinensis var. chinensis]|uniref:RING-type E3 ubiquitin transferase n=1 Tax=Actinidia chinensis var. chinensis TaxID=1590841 RepID=A0A2R6P4I4_ACTCC|nr:E3 ubiquitin-protein ligase RHA4A [Actinidia chinensis var. chinensis]